MTALYLGKFTRSFVVRNGSSHDAPVRAHDSPEKGAELTRSICLAQNFYTRGAVEIRQHIKEKLMCINSSYFYSPDLSDIMLLVDRDHG